MPTFIIKESTTGTLSFSLKDEAEVAIPLASLLTLRLTVKDVVSDTVVNGRDAQDILNTNDVVVDASCNCAWALTQEDTALVNETNLHELHRGLVDFTYDAAGTTKRYHQDFELTIAAEDWVP